jgi:hypothetical protein
MTLTVEAFSRNAAQRVARAIVFTVGLRRWYWSYADCIAFERAVDATGKICQPVMIRRERFRSTASEHHAKMMGIMGFEPVPDDVFERMAQE